MLFFASVGGSGVASTFTVGVSTVVAVGATSGVGVNVLALGGIGSGAVTGTAASTGVGVSSTIISSTLAGLVGAL